MGSSGSGRFTDTREADSRKRVTKAVAGLPLMTVVRRHSVPNWRMSNTVNITRCMGIRRPWALCYRLVLQSASSPLRMAASLEIFRQSSIIWPRV